jgi:hydrogenase maturation protein HypF
MLQKNQSITVLDVVGNAVSRLCLHITGAVQGVGFRPFVYNLAQQLHLAGWVRNDIRGLYIEVEGNRNELEVFLCRLQNEAPPIAEIRQIDQFQLSPRGETEFRIAVSENLPEAQPRPSVLPDLASCPECLKETQDPHNRRYRYPFTSCTLCGPRWSIIEALPYDRPNTGMRGFPFCPDCEREYTSPADRRFHHQANACPVCGPQLTLVDRSGATLATQDEALQQTITALRQGRIVALKGIGGFQLLIDAHNNHAIRELRRRKQRPSKPFALLCPDLKQIAQFCDTSREEIALLHSAAAPIVLLKKKPGIRLSEAIAPGNPYLGIMLPCSVLHHLLAGEFGTALICTSGNLSGDPICKDNDEALEQLQNIADLFLLHNRPVIRALDDSVAQVVMGKTGLLRRARGYAPRPIEIKTGKSSPAVLAVGAHIKNTVALSLPGENQNTEIMLSAHLGDLDAPGTRTAFENRIAKYKELYRLKPELLVYDLHPDYHSTQYAIRLPGKKLAVQHHWAHIVACLAEHRLEGKVLGIAWDGVGLGDDGNAWGGEFMLADAHGYRRLGHLLPFVLPGGDAAAKDSRRAMLGALYTAADGSLPQVQQWLPSNVFTEYELRTFISMLQGEVNTLLTTSAGRLFDAVSSLLGLCQRNTFEGEAAMLLQFAAEAGSVDTTQKLPQLISRNRSTIDWRPLLRLIIERKHAGESVNKLARLFHQTLVKAIVDFAVNIPGYAVVLTGGCFQNRLLLQLAIEALQQQQIEVYWPQQIPANDGGVAFGQAVIGVNHYSNHKDTKNTKQ